MNALFSLYKRFSSVAQRADWLIPTLARFLFAAILLVYFLNAGLVKMEDGISNLWMPSAKGYIQIFPKAFDAAGYDAEAMSLYHQVVVSLGTIAEFVLPVLVVLGLLTRLAALGMIGFVAVQSLTDIYGHGQAGETGAWFDRFPDHIILDQRALWIFLLLVLVIKGAGPLSFDRALQMQTPRPA
ncbi:MAG: DoxX family membrane protein [Sulfitobacter sp.]